MPPSASTGQGNTLHWETVAKTHACIFGFVQPNPFISKVLPLIIAEDDGLYDRFLICVPKVSRLNVDALTESAQAFAQLDCSPPGY